jgi:Cys-tRNA(Pro)/Cys-tRNA(Cys) deacylase
MVPMGTQATRAIDSARAAGIIVRVLEYRHEPRAAQRERGGGYALEAVLELGVDAARVFKTLVVAVDGRLALAVVPAPMEADLKAIGAALGGRRAALADAADAERATGYVLGGISPLGTRRPLPAVVDASVMDHDTVLVSAGRRGLEIELAPADLVAVAGAVVAAIARPPTISGRRPRPPIPGRGP